MAKEKLEISIEYNYKVIAIASSLKDYRVSFLLNSALNIELKKVDNIIIDNKTKQQVSTFEIYKDNETNLLKHFFLVSNKTIGQQFISSLKSFDFIFIIKSEEKISDYENIFSTIKNLDKFQIVLKIETLSKRDRKTIEDNIIYFKRKQNNV